MSVTLVPKSPSNMFEPVRIITHNYIHVQCNKVNNYTEYTCTTCTCTCITNKLYWYSIPASKLVPEFDQIPLILVVYQSQYETMSYH